MLRHKDNLSFEDHFKENVDQIRHGQTLDEVLDASFGGERLVHIDWVVEFDLLSPDFVLHQLLLGADTCNHWLHWHRYFINYILDKSLEGKLQLL